MRSGPPICCLKIAWNCSGMNRGICSHQFPPLGGSPLIGRTLALCSPGFGREIFGSHWIFCFILWELGREGDATRVLAQKTRSRSLRSNPVASSFLAPGFVGRCLFWTHCTWTQSGRTETFFSGFGLRFMFFNLVQAERRKREEIPRCLSASGRFSCYPSPRLLPGFR